MESLQRMPVVGEVLVRISMPTNQFPLLSEGFVVRSGEVLFRVENGSGGKMAYNKNGFARWALKSEMYTSNEEAARLLRED